MNLNKSFETILLLDPPQTALDVLRAAKSVSRHPDVITSLVEHVVQTRGIVTEDIKRLLQIMLTENMIEILVKDIRVPPWWMCCCCS